MGRIFGRLMERLNRPAYGAATHALTPRDGERFLEIGFGTGRLVELLLHVGPNVRVCGVDPTPTMVEVASQRREVMAAGSRVDLREGKDAPLPWPSDFFDGVAALHSFQFWPEPTVSIREIRRVLRPGGRLLLILRDHSRNPRDWLPNPLSRSGQEVELAKELLRASGFEVTLESLAGSSQVILASVAAEPSTA